MCSDSSNPRNSPKRTSWTNEFAISKCIGALLLPWHQEPNYFKTYLNDWSQEGKAQSIKKPCRSSFMYVLLCRRQIGSGLCPKLKSTVICQGIYVEKLVLSGHRVFPEEFIYLLEGRLSNRDWGTLPQKRTTAKEETINVVMIRRKMVQKMTTERRALKRY